MNFVGEQTVLFYMRRSVSIWGFGSSVRNDGGLGIASTSVQSKPRCIQTSSRIQCHRGANSVAKHTRREPKLHHCRPRSAIFIHFLHGAGSHRQPSHSTAIPTKTHSGYIFRLAGWIYNVVRFQCGKRTAIRAPTWQNNAIFHNPCQMFISKFRVVCYNCLYEPGGFRFHDIKRHLQCAARAKNKHVGR